MLLPIILLKRADDDSLSGTGMDDFPVFQVDAHMGGGFLFSPVVEEDQVTLAELAFLHFPAIFLPLVIGVSFEVLSVYFFIDG